MRPPARSWTSLPSLVPAALHLVWAHPAARLPRSQRAAPRAGRARGGRSPGSGDLFVSRSRGALGLLERLLTGIGRTLGFSTAARGLNLGANVALLYEHRGRVLAATAIHLGAWFLGALQVWVAAALLGRPIAAGTALALASVAYAARGALFIVPMGAGIREAGFVLVGAVLGIGEAAAIAFSLVLRARDVLLGAPAVLLWSAAELRQLRRRRPVTAPAG